MDLSSQLKYHAVLYEPRDFTNDMDETDSEYEPCERFWCGIVPVSGRVDKSLPGGAETEEVTHKITVRMNASRRLRKAGGRQHTRLRICGVWYDVLYVLPQYQQGDRMLIYAKMRYE